MTLSVIVPVYKAEKYLKRSVDSILCQTYSDLEVILVDDGSPDSCPQICDAYQKQDTRVVVLHQKNAGVSAARNAGLDRASGEYITFVDSDDYIEPNMYASMMKTVQEYNCDVVLCDCVKEFSDHKELYTHDIRPGFYDKHQLQKEYYPHLLIMENVEYPATISNCLLVFKNDKKFSTVRYIEGVRYSEDWLFGACLMYLADSFYYMSGQSFYHYCMNEQSATHNHVADKWNDYEILYKKMQSYFSQCEDYDFSEQLDKVLLFLVYNAVGEILFTEDICKAKKILLKDYVRSMFSRLQIRRLPISWKLKCVTYIYKYPFWLWLFMYVQKFRRRNAKCQNL